MNRPVRKQLKGDLFIIVGIAAIVGSIGYESYSFFSRITPQAGVQIVRQSDVSVFKKPLTVSPKYLQGADWQQDPKAGTAYTHWSFICKSEFVMQLDQTKSKDGAYCFVLRAATVDLELPITVWLPFGISTKLREHEDGHRQICARIYADADKIALDCATKLVGHEFVERAPTIPEAELLAAQQARVMLSTSYAERTEAVSLAVSDLYDKITNHGMNSITTSSGVDQAFAQSPTKLTLPQLKEDATE